jgi:hypothetical protein
MNSFITEHRTVFSASAYLGSGGEKEKVLRKLDNNFDGKLVDLPKAVRSSLRSKLNCKRCQSTAPEEGLYVRVVPRGANSPTSQNSIQNISQSSNA